jgi:hypothetical protein
MTQLAEAALRSMIGPARATLAAVDHVRGCKAGRWT